MSNYFSEVREPAGLNEDGIRNSIQTQTDVNLTQQLLNSKAESMESNTMENTDNKAVSSIPEPVQQITTTKDSKKAQKTKEVNKKKQPVASDVTPATSTMLETSGNNPELPIKSNLKVKSSNEKQEMGNEDSEMTKKPPNREATITFNPEVKTINEIQEMRASPSKDSGKSKKSSGEKHEMRISPSKDSTKSKKSSNRESPMKSNAEVNTINNTQEIRISPSKESTTKKSSNPESPMKSNAEVNVINETQDIRTPPPKDSATSGKSLDRESPAKSNADVKTINETQDIRTSPSKDSETTKKSSNRKSVKNSTSINEKENKDCKANSSKEEKKEEVPVVNIQELTEQLMNLLNDGKNDDDKLTVQELLKKNVELQEFIVKLIQVLKEKTTLCANLERQNSALIGQAQSLKDVISITKDLLGIRNMEVEHLHADMASMENSIKEERLRHNNAVAKLNEAMSLNNKLKNEYLIQMDLFQKLREKYNEKVVVLTKENQRLKEIVQSHGLESVEPQAGPANAKEEEVSSEELAEENVDK